MRLAYFPVVRTGMRCLCACLYLSVLSGSAMAQAGESALPCRVQQQSDLAEHGQVDRLLQEAGAERDAGRWDRALVLAGDARELAVKLNDEVGDAWAAVMTGSILLRSLSFDEARRELERARQIAAGLGCERMVVWADLYLYATAGQQGEVDRSMAGLADVVAKAGRLGDTGAFSLANYHLGMLCRNQNRGDEALAYFDAALTDTVSAHGWLLAATLTAAGTVLGGRGLYPAAVKRFEEALIAWRSVGNCMGEADAHHYLGNVSFHLGDYDVALDHYLTALTNRQETGPPLKVGESLHDIGHIYFKQEHYAEALDQYASALALFQAAGNRLRTGQAYGSMGNVYSRMGDVESALNAYETSLGILEEIGDKATLVYTLNNLGQLYVEREQFSLAQERLWAARTLALELEDRESVSLCYYNLAAAAFGQGRWAAARDFLDSSLVVCAQTGSKDLLMWGHYLSARVDSALGKPMAALEHYKQYKLYSDSLQAAEKDRLHAEMKARYESEQKADALRRIAVEHELQQVKLRRQTTMKNVLLAALALGVVLGFFIYRYYVTRQRLRIQVLRNRIAADLHDDVGSTLSSIAMFSEIAQQQSAEVMPLLQTIGESSRKMLEAMTDIVWTINPDNDQFEHIILRMRNYAYELLAARGIGLDFTADEGMEGIRLPMDVRRNLFLIFKEATNNILKYAEADMALFSISADRDQVSMVIRDNGKGFDTVRATSGNGLRNMRRRAEEVGGLLVIESAPGSGTMVRFSISV